MYSGRGPKSAIAEISTGGCTRGASEIGNCRKWHQGSREGCAQNRQLPKVAPGLEERTKTLVHRVMLQPQGFSGNHRTYCRFSTPTLKRKLPKCGRGPKSAISHTFVRSTYSRRRFQPKRVKRRNNLPCVRNRQLPKSAPGVARRVRPKSAIAEISTRGRTKGAPEIGNCPNQHRGTPHNHLTSKLATTTTGSRGAYLLDARLHPFIAFHGNKQRASV